MASASAKPTPREPSNHDNISTPTLQDTFKELKSIKKQLYSAAEFFEVSYINEKHKKIVMESLKDYSLKALVNTVDHLGSVAYKITNFVQDNGVEISRMQLRLCSLQQRVETCQKFVGLGGVSQQSLTTESPKYHKHYTCPAEDRFEHENGESIGKWPSPSLCGRLRFNHSLKNVDAGSPSSHIWEEFFVSQSPDLLPPSPTPPTFPLTASWKSESSSEASPHHHQFPMPCSGSPLIRRPISPTNYLYPIKPCLRQPQRTTSLPVERESTSTTWEQEAEVHHSAGKGKRLLKAMLSLRRSKGVVTFSTNSWTVINP